MPLKVFSRSATIAMPTYDSALLTLTLTDEDEYDSEQPPSDAWSDLASHIAHLALTKRRTGTVPDDREIFYRGAWRTRREFAELRSHRLRTFHAYLDGDSSLHGP